MIRYVRYGSIMTAVTTVALGVFLLFGLLNLYLVVRNRNGANAVERLRSTVPLAGGIAGVIGFAEVDALRPYAWSPLILDLGATGFVGCTLLTIARDRWQLSSFNLLREYRAAGDGSKTGTLRLFKSGVFVLRLDFHRTQGELGISQFSRIGTWRDAATGLQLETRDGKSAELHQHDGRPPGTLEVASDFPTFATDAELALTGLTFAETAGSASNPPS